MPWIDAPRCLALALALAAPACVQILGATDHYYVVDGGSGGAPATTGSTTSTSSGAPTTSTTSTSSASGTGGGTGGGGGCGVPVTAAPGPCGAGSIGTVVDDFNDDATAPMWATYAIPPSAISVTEKTGAVVIDAAGTKDTFAGYVTAGSYSLAGCQVSLEVRSAPVSASASTHLTFSPDPSTQTDVLEINVGGATLLRRVVVSGVEVKHSVPYDPVCHRFWRLRELGGTTYAETSPDGKTWYELGSDPTPGFIGAGRVDFGLYLFADTPQPTPVVFDNFNVTP
jgi:hypothetical protein